MATMIAPAAFFSAQARGGTQYTADAQGFIANVDPNDAISLLAEGCVFPSASGVGLIGRLLGANLNITTDQPIAMLIDPSVSFRVTKISAKNASAAAASAAAGGIYTAASKGGTAVVASTQSWLGLSGSTLVLDLTIATTPGKTEFPGSTPLILALTTGNGVALTADLYVYGDLYK